MLNIAIAALVAAAGSSSPELTIYNQGIGFVKEVRSIDLKPGQQTLEIEDVPARIDPTSVGFRSLTAPDSFDVLEQNYRYDLISRQAILDKSVGKRIRFIRTIGGTRDVLEGVLLSAPTSIVATPEGGTQQTYNGMVIRTDDGRIALDPTGEIEVQQVPEGLISRPTLFWDLDARRSGPNSVELSYITNGMSWEANYVLTLGSADTADLQGWVTIHNDSGATFKNAKLNLLAGDVNVVRPMMAERGFAFGGGMGGAPATPQFEQQNLFEYHLYTLQRPATVKDKETKQISLLEADSVPFQRKVVVDSMYGYYDYHPTEGEIGTGDLKPQVRIEFTNDEKSHLGIPLPKGKFRIYQRDKSGSVQFIGEDNIDHTPKNEHVSLVVGRSFDIRATRRRTDFKRINALTVQESFDIEVRNRKDVADTVYVIERHWGDWRVLQKSQDFTKPDSNSMQFVVNLQPNEVKTVSYTVETKW